MAFGRDSIESVSTPSSIELEEKFCRIKKLTRDGSLADSSDVGADSRASGLDGHLGGQARGEDTRRGHCD